MRKYILLTALVVGIAAVAVADITWFNTATNRIANSDGTTVLTGDTIGFPQGSNFSCFVQLIWAGPTDGIDTAVGSGTGVSGDDQVFAVGYIAQSTFFNGYLAPPTLDVGDMGADNYFYVRAWSTNSPAYDGTSNSPVPTASTIYYGESEVWQYVYSDVSATGWDFGGAGDGSNIGWNTDQQVIPEPSAIALLLLGLLGLRAYQRKRA